MKSKVRRRPLMAAVWSVTFTATGKPAYPGTVTECSTVRTGQAPGAVLTGRVAQGEGERAGDG
ncbi:hypothetical protein [Streptomyces sp. ID05-47C]|uniref:hypothetical protein n=1 Tax=Streptomyces sp. ID05-47C TaxID=3028665 RepID=UPI0029A91535|nr:hypothetical protein [Streptomyces sp. ID05-47C]MDX3572301.1 hypothetical protein [Streptomyces sp. ID05-47C]